MGYVQNTVEDSMWIEVYPECFTVNINHICLFQSETKTRLAV